MSEKNKKYLRVFSDFDTHGLVIVVEPRNEHLSITETIKIVNQEHPRYKPMADAIDECSCKNKDDGSIIDPMKTTIGSLPFKEIRGNLLVDITFDKKSSAENCDGKKTNGFFPVTPSDEFLAFTTEDEEDRK